MCVKFESNPASSLLSINSWKRPLSSGHSLGPISRTTLRMRQQRIRMHRARWRNHSVWTKKPVHQIETITVIHRTNENRIPLTIKASRKSISINSNSPKLLVKVIHASNNSHINVIHCLGQLHSTNEITLRNTATENSHSRYKFRILKINSNWANYSKAHGFIPKRRGRTILPLERG